MSSGRTRTRAVTLLLVVLASTATVACSRAQDRETVEHSSPPATATHAASWNFDDLPAGTLPAGWKVEATNRKGPLATWNIVKDATAPSGDQVLALTRPNHTFGGTFNLCWTNAVSFLDGEIQVRFKAVKGEEDQGGGVIWRAKDKDNYYIARFNPLEDNFRLYSVRDGARRMLADAKVALAAGAWHTLRIVQQGARFEGYLDGKKLLEGANGLFTKPGGVGLWTKADAVTTFDDLSVQAAKPDSDRAPRQR